jgi:hypothetical protein
MNGRLLYVGAVAAAAALLVASCVGDTPNTSPTTQGPDGSTSDEPSPDTGAPDDAAAPGDSSVVEEITDGGGLPEEDEDAGLDDDAGIDAGPACGSLTPGPYVDTTCATFFTTPTGGSLTTTTYQLAGVTVLGAPAFCSGTYQVYEHRGMLKVTATNNATARFEFVDYYRKDGSALRPTSVRYDVDVTASGTTLTYSPTACATRAAPSSASYWIGTNGGKKQITLKLPYGTGSALYRFVQL